jgi:hypothetical protein
MDWKVRKPTGQEQKTINWMRPYMNTAIKTAENNPKTFGVMGAKNPTQANQVLNNSIQNDYIRWMMAKQPGKFVDFMQKIWAPIGVSNDPKNLNINWAPNVRKSLKKQGVEEEFKKQNLSQSGDFSILDRPV